MKDVSTSVVNVDGTSDVPIRGRAVARQCNNPPGGGGEIVVAADTVSRLKVLLFEYHISEFLAGNMHGWFTSSGFGYLTGSAQKIFTDSAWYVVSTR